MPERPYEENERIAAGFNHAAAMLRGYVAAYADGNRRHIAENITATVGALREDLTDASKHQGGMSESFLAAVCEITRLLCVQAVGPDPAAQLDCVAEALEAFGERVERSS